MTSREDMARIIDAVVEDAREGHRIDVNTYGDGDSGHTALSERGVDVECLTCGHINEAEYLSAELQR